MENGTFKKNFHIWNQVENWEIARKALRMEVGGRKLLNTPNLHYGYSPIEFEDDRLQRPWKWFSASVTHIWFLSRVNSNIAFQFLFFWYSTHTRLKILRSKIPQKSLFSTIAVMMKLSIYFMCKWFLTYAMLHIYALSSMFHYDLLEHFFPWN